MIHFQFSCDHAGCKARTPKIAVEKIEDMFADMPALPKGWCYKRLPVRQREPGLKIDYQFCPRHGEMQ